MRRSHISPKATGRLAARVQNTPGGGRDAVRVRQADHSSPTARFTTRNPDYLPLITQRINRRRDPIAYLTAAGEDLGLFAE